MGRQIIRMVFPRMAFAAALALIFALGLLGPAGAFSGGARADGEANLNELVEQFETRQFKMAKWPNVTVENKLEIMRVAALTSADTDTIARHVSRLVDRVRKSMFACAAHGRVDPEIAIEIVRTALLSQAQVEDVADDFREQCGKGDVVNLGWLSDENCMEIIKISKLKGVEFDDALKAVKSLRGLGLVPGINGDTVTELVKTSILTGQSTETLYGLFRSAYGNTLFGRSWKLSSEAAVSLVKAAALAGHKDMNTALLAFKDLHGNFGIGGSGYLFSEMVKLSIASGASVATLRKSVTDAYGWGIHDLRYGLSQETVSDLQKLAYRDQGRTRDLLLLDHKFRNGRVDRFNCAERLERESRPAAGGERKASKANP